MIFQKELFNSLKSNAGRIAIETNHKTLNYDEVLRRANKITTYLLEENLKPETMVGIEMSDKVNLIISMIGIMNARCVVVPLDPNMPTRRKLGILEDLKLNHLIIPEKYSKAHGFSDYGINQMYSFDEIINSKSGSFLSTSDFPTYEEDDSIYIYFTSGSTGKPKGVVGKNCSLTQFLKWEIDTFEIDQNFRFSQFISPYFDAFLRDIFTPLLSGGVICIPPDEDDFFTSEKMISWIDSSKINIIHCVPSLFRVFGQEKLGKNLFKNLKNVLLSGEKIVPSSLKYWYSIFGERIQLVNLYGTTETTMIRTFYRIKKEDTHKLKISIGEPLPDTHLLVVNDNNEPSKIYEMGNLYICSDYLTKGYFNSEKLNGEKFKFMSIGNEKSMLAFRTGDRARILNNGQIELMGRDDRQIKLNGIRVELDEIERIILESKLVENAVVLVSNDNNEEKEKRLAAYFVRSKNSPQAISLVEPIRTYMQVFLPSYMIPSKINEVDEFPLLFNGKINYAELLKGTVEKELIAPSNEEENKLLFIWSEILNEKNISTHDNFHQIGGNSLSMMRLIAKIYKEFNVRVSLNDLFNNLTIQKQASLIRSSQLNTKFIIDKADLQERYKLTSAQERIYYQYQLNKDSTTYNMPVVKELPSEATVEKIENIIVKLIRRHESLRTKFEFYNGDIFQIICEEEDFVLQNFDVRETGIDKAINKLIKPFDLERAPLFRAFLLKVSDGRRLLLFDTHHIICDGVSQVNLLADFHQFYAGNKLSPINLQYRDYSVWENKFKMTDEYIIYREFWLKMFEGGDVPKLNLPEVNDFLDSDFYRGNTINLKINREIFSPLIRFLKENEVTNFSGLFSLYHLFLRQLTGHADIVIGINTSGREQEELKNMVGMFAKTLPVRHKSSDELNFKDFVLKTHRFLIQITSRQLYDLADIMKDLKLETKGSTQELFETMLVFQNFETSENTNKGKEFEDFEFENRTTKYPIALFVYEDKEENCFQFKFECMAKNFSTSDMDGLAHQFESLVERAMGNLDANISTLINGNSKSLEYDQSDISFNF